MRVIFDVSAIETKVGGRDAVQPSRPRVGDFARSRIQTSEQAYDRPSEQACRRRAAPAQDRAVQALEQATNALAEPQSVLPSRTRLPRSMRVWIASPWARFACPPILAVEADLIGGACRATTRPAPHRGSAFRHWRRGPLPRGLLGRRAGGQTDRGGARAASELPVRGRC